MIGTSKMSDAEREKMWQGQDDAMTLSRAEAIKADKARLDNATVEAKRMLEESEQELNGIRKVAGKKPVQTQTKPQTQSRNMYSSAPSQTSTKAVSNPWGRDPFSFPTM